jgi:hypothetical protein
MFPSNQEHPSAASDVFERSMSCRCWSLHWGACQAHLRKLTLQESAHHVAFKQCGLNVKALLGLCAPCVRAQGTGSGCTPAYSCMLLHVRNQK